jgi:hypothetical protein
LRNSSEIMKEATIPHLRDSSKIMKETTIPHDFRTVPQV